MVELRFKSDLSDSEVLDLQEKVREWLFQREEHKTLCSKTGRHQEGSKRGRKDIKSVNIY